jgi:SAM-dependent methyltransferase
LIPQTAEFVTVTEIPGNKASREQLERLYDRYHFAAAFCRDRDILEAACGAGMGLGYLARTARMVVGGDINEIVLAIAQNQYQGRPNIIVKKFDAQELPFPDQSFDVVLLYEAIYYLASPEKFVQEAKRVLRPGGRLIIGSVNKEWSDFNPSPFSRKYFTAAEVAEQLRPHFREIRAFGAFPVRAATPRDRIVSLFKRIAIKLRLMPKTMKGKELFKRIFFGRLVPIPPELAVDGALDTPQVPLAIDAPNPQVKIFYVIARR